MSISLPAVLSDRFCRSSVRVALLTASFSLLPGLSLAQSIGTGGSISVPVNSFAPASSTLSVGASPAQLVKTVVVHLNNVNSNGTVDESIQNTEMILTSPSGNQLILLLGTGDSTDGNGLNNATILVEDGAASAPDGTPWSTSGGTVKPTVDWEGAPPIPGKNYPASEPQPSGSATLASAFSGTTANGTWTLTLETASGSVAAVSVGSWTIDLTYQPQTEAPTATAVSSSATNPVSYASSAANITPTFTATVSSGSGTPTGTVAFTSNGAAVSGCTTVGVSGGIAQCAIALSQGYNIIGAAYTPNSGSFGQSSSTMTQLVEITPTANGNTWCNTGSLSVPVDSIPLAYPDIIKVSGYPDGTTVGNVTVTLTGVTEASGLSGQFLLVAPGGNNLDFLDEGFQADNSAVNLTFSDTAGSAPNDGPANAGTYLPYDANNNPTDSFPAGTSPIIDNGIPAVPGTPNYPAPRGGANAFTFEQAFNGSPANGDWSLYASTEDGGGLLQLAGGWCVDLEINSGTATTTVLSSTKQHGTTGQQVTITATVLAGGSPVTQGTIGFVDATTGAVLNNAVPLNGSGVATYTTSSLAEGDHKINATYSGTNNFNTSFGSLYQRIDNATTVSGVTNNSAQFCNTGAVQIAAGASGAFTPNPSNIFVNNLPGTLDTVGVTLEGFAVPGGDQLFETESLVEGPTGTALDFFSNIGGGLSTASRGNYLFSDAGTGTLPNYSQDSNIGPGSYPPTSFSPFTNIPDKFTSSVSGFYPAPSSFTYAPTQGSGTFNDVFNAINPNGTWSLFFNQTDEGAVAGAANGWCVNVTTKDLPAATVTASHTGTFAQGQSGAQLNIAITNNGPGKTGDPSNGSNPMTVTDTLNAAFTYSGFTGADWVCSASGQTVTCANLDGVAEGSSYPALAINVNVAGAASGTITNTVSASGAGVSATQSNTDSLSIAVAPVITSGNNATFAAGMFGTFPVTATGMPTPSFSTTGTLPSGVTLTDNGNGTATLSGTPANGTGGPYTFNIIAQNGAGPGATQSFTLTINTTIAQIITPAPSSMVTGATVPFTWTTATGATAYYLSVGTTGVGSTNIFNLGWRNVTTWPVSNLPGNNTTLYVRLSTKFGTTVQFNDYTYVSSNSAMLSTPAPNSTLTGISQNFSWSAVPHATGYALFVGSTGTGSDNIFGSAISTNTSYTVSPLPVNGGTVYVRLFTFFGSVSIHNDYTLTASTSAASTIISPAPNSVLSGKTVPFTWTSSPMASDYYLTVGSTGPGSNNLFNLGWRNVTSWPVGGLPVNGQPVYVRLFTRYNGTSTVFVDYIYTAQ